MNSSTLNRNTGTQWLRRGIALSGTLLVAGAIALGLAGQARTSVTPAPDSAIVRAPASSYERYKDFKLAQIERMSMPPSRDGMRLPASVAALLRYVDHKLEQIVAPDSRTAPSARPAGARARYEHFKLAQVEQLDVADVHVATPSAAWARYEHFKLAQVERIDPRAARPASTDADMRYEHFKQQQVDQQEAWATPEPPALLAARSRYSAFKLAQIEGVR